jgi:peptidoglycan hydrolase-like protein with peptidoglycan-binding domain
VTHRTRSAKAAVRDYQQKNGLVTDGIAGPATLAHMKLFKEITADTAKARQEHSIRDSQLWRGHGLRKRLEARQQPQASNPTHLTD